MTSLLDLWNPDHTLVLVYFIVTNYNQDMPFSSEQLIDKADSIRRDVIEVAVRNGAGHIAPSLSCIDILTALYYDLMRYNPADPHDPQRDRLIFSKSHGCYGHYAILSDIGFIPTEQWQSFYTPASRLSGCAERNVDFGLEAGCGSLGHGLPLATGLAWGAKLQGLAWHTYCIVGDGEFQEGTCWEALIFAIKHKLDNLTIIIDANGLQAMDHIINVMDNERLALYKRLSGFGAKLADCYGHDPSGISATIRHLQGLMTQSPNVILAQTVKGYGLKCMENIPKFHFRIPTEQELAEGRP